MAEPLAVGRSNLKLLEPTFDERESFLEPLDHKLLTSSKVVGLGCCSAWSVADSVGFDISNDVVGLKNRALQEKFAFEMVGVDEHLSDGFLINPVEKLSLHFGG